MPRFYITQTEQDISFTKINEVLVNHVSSSAYSGSVSSFSGFSRFFRRRERIPEQRNSTITSLADQSYKYLFSQKIDSLTKRPIKFSDFRNNLFFASTVTVVSETPSRYGNYNDGSISIVPIGGTATSFKIKIYYPVVETYIDGYNPPTTTRRSYVRWFKRYWYDVVQENPIYKTRINEVVVAETVCLRGGNLTKTNLNTGDYGVRVTQLDDALNVINSYNYQVEMTYGLPVKIYTEYFRR